MITSTSTNETNPATTPAPLDPRVLQPNSAPTDDASAVNCPLSAVNCTTASPIADDEPDTAEEPVAADEPDADFDFDAADEPVLRKWTPGATTSQIISGAARDLAELISLLIARQRVAVGYAADKDSIVLALKLTCSLRELAQLIHTTEITRARRGGRPPKPGNFTPNDKPAGKPRRPG